jgi:hypothetical protein
VTRLPQAKAQANPGHGGRADGRTWQFLGRSRKDFAKKNSKVFKKIKDAKKTPNLADRGESTFSEGGGDNGLCLKKHECANCSAIHAALPQSWISDVQSFMKFLSLRQRPDP